MAVPTSYLPELVFPARGAVEAIEAAPAISPVDDIYPLVAPAAANSNAEEFDVLGYLGNISPMKSVPLAGLKRHDRLLEAVN